jgi:hypothetical protein
MWFRWLATVRSPRKRAAATSRFVLPSATSSATRRSAAVSPSARVRPLIRPSSARAFAAQPSAPTDSNASRAAAIASRAGRFCAPSAERVADRFVLDDRLSKQIERRLDLSLRGGDETPAARDVGEHPFALDPYRVRLPRVEDLDRVVDSPELEQKLDAVAGPPADARLVPAHCRRVPVGLVEPGVCRRQVCVGQRDEPEDAPVLRYVQAARPTRQVVRAQ